MKIKERALAILLSMVMMLAFMPALAFADTSWSASAAQKTVFLSGSTATDPGSAELEVVIDRGAYEGKFTYEWYKSSGTEEEDALLEGDAA